MSCLTGAIKGGNRGWGIYSEARACARGGVVWSTWKPWCDLGFEDWSVGCEVCERDGEGWWADVKDLECHTKKFLL